MIGSVGRDSAVLLLAELHVDVRGHVDQVAGVGDEAAADGVARPGELLASEHAARAHLQ